MCRLHGEQRLVPADASAEACVKCVRDERVRNGECACGCRGSLAGRARNVRYAADGHRNRPYREDLKARAEALGIPASLSLKNLDSATATRNRRRDGEAARDEAGGAPRTPRKPSLRISYRRALAAIESALADHSLRCAATDALTSCLTDQQKATLPEQIRELGGRI